MGQMFDYITANDEILRILGDILGTRTNDLDKTAPVEQRLVYSVMMNYQELTRVILEQG